MALGFTRRYSTALGVAAMLSLALSAGFASVSYPLRPPPDAGDPMALPLLVIVPAAIAGGLLLALLYRRERLRTHASVWWLLVYPVGAVIGVSVPASYLLLSPSFGGGVRGWYEMGIVTGGIFGVIAEVVSWRRDER